MIDWRLPENRRELFQRHYSFQLKHLNFPGMVYSMLPAIADHFNLDDDGKAWLVWLNGNTQNVVTSYLLLEQAPTHKDYLEAIWFWNEHFKQLEWDTDRRHQKSKFGAATAQWIRDFGDYPAFNWLMNTATWEEAWAFSKSQPYMGRLSAWSMMEYARILLGPSIPDMGSFLLNDVSGSRSHRNGLAVIAGYDSWDWDADVPFMLGIVPRLEELAEDLLLEARGRNMVTAPDCYCPPPYDMCMHGPEPDPNVTRLTLESCLCTTKSFFKPNRRYPNVYADMMYQRIKKAETRFGRSLDVLWDIRKRTLPDYLRLEDNPRDPGLSPIKQNLFRERGEVPVIGHDFPDMWSEFDTALDQNRFDFRKDPKW